MSMLSLEIFDFRMKATFSILNFYFCDVDIRYPVCANFSFWKFRARVVLIRFNHVDASPALASLPLSRNAGVAGHATLRTSICVCCKIVVLS